MIYQECFSVAYLRISIYSLSRKQHPQTAVKILLSILKASGIEISLWITAHKVFLFYIANNKLPFIFLLFSNQIIQNSWNFQRHNLL